MTEKLLKVTSPINELVIRDKSNQISLSKVISDQEIGDQFYDDLLSTVAMWPKIQYND